MIRFNDAIIYNRWVAKWYIVIGDFYYENWYYRLWKYSKFFPHSKLFDKYFCDIIPERAKAAVEKDGCGIAVTDYKDVLKDDEIEAISICTHNYTHSIIAIDALHAGINVLCEKTAA